MTREQLDLRICDVEEGASNTQTYREFMTSVYDDLGVDSPDLDSMTDEKLSRELDWCDEMMDK